MPGFGAPFSGLANERKLTKQELVRSIRFMVAAEYEARREVIHKRQQPMNIVEGQPVNHAANALPRTKTHIPKTMLLSDNIQVRCDLWGVGVMSVAPTKEYD